MPAIRQAFEVSPPASVDEIVRVLLLYGDCSFALGALAVVLFLVVGWIVRDVALFVRNELAVRRRDAH